MLEAYTNGLINKWTMEPRERYIFDSSPIEEDMRQNNLTVRTFLYLQYLFADLSDPERRPPRPSTLAEPE